MSFSRLYQAVQAHKDHGVPRISTNWLRDQAVELSHITKVKEQWSGIIDHTAVRGFYIEGPVGPPVPLAENECLIVLSRAMCDGGQGEHWRRFVLTKELMHVFDDVTEITDTIEKFDVQIEKFRDPDAQISPQFRAEIKAMWRALAVLCRERDRLEFKRQVDEHSMSHEVVAAALAIPASYIRVLLRDDFEKIIGAVM